MNEHPASYHAMNFEGVVQILSLTLPKVLRNQLQEILNMNDLTFDRIINCAYYIDIIKTC